MNLLSIRLDPKGLERMQHIGESAQFALVVKHIIDPALFDLQRRVMTAGFSDQNNVAQAQGAYQALADLLELVGAESAVLTAPKT